MNHVINDGENKDPYSPDLLCFFNKTLAKTELGEKGFYSSL